MWAILEQMRDHAQQRVVAFLVRTDVAGIGFRQCPAAGAQPQVVAQVVDALAEPPRFGFRPFEQRHGHAHGRFGPEAGQPRQLLHERLQRFRDSVVHTSSFGWTENWGRGNLSSERLPALLSMPVSLGDASTGTARSGGTIRSSSPPQKLPLSFPKLLTLSNPCSQVFGDRLLLE